MSRQRSAFTVIQVLAVIASFVLLTGFTAVVWYGSMRSTDVPPPTPASSPTPAVAPSKTISDEDRQLIDKQKICPVSGEPLESMHEPYRAEVDGKPVFVCCKSCTSALKKDPAKYLEKLK